MATYLLPDHDACYNPKPINGDNQIQTEEQEAYDQKLDAMIATLPKNKGWRSQYIFRYKGFWASREVIRGQLLIGDHFHPQPTDIFLAAFMKCGTTWLKALMFATVNRQRYNFSDHPLLRTGPQSVFPFLDTHIFLDHPITNFDHLPAPRLFATHNAHSSLPTSMTSPASTCKFVYVCRDPKDALISKWHFMRKLRSKELPPISFNEAFELFCNGVSEYGPFWDHVLGYWKASQESPEKILFLKYEDMKREPTVELKKLAAFMGTPFTEEEEKKGVVEEIVKLCSFENLSNLEVNKGGGGGQKFTAKVVVENREFFRKGKVGDWENYLTEEMKNRIDTITINRLKGSGLIMGATKTLI
ncbi:cytosolic sulfotransferase 5-like [Cynara cardunculus var. scolymus]|uniref:cytosolic sulfotransferase 5-like n=1 Tax=Cynara cardunculus var. scolymus TaxID=59895 RepID=UPI000D62CFF3|nr:cytosolic sulfotransferase 5-like [Cynara cardunculus var. scolymus]